MPHSHQDQFAGGANPLKEWSLKYFSGKSSTLSANYLSKYCYLIAMFGLKKEKEEPLSDGIRTYLERITILESRVTSLELNQDAFRDKVLRKLQNHAPEEEKSAKLNPGSKVRR